MQSRFRKENRPFDESWVCVSGNEYPSNYERIGPEQRDGIYNGLISSSTRLEKQFITILHIL